MTKVEIYKRLKIVYRLLCDWRPDENEKGFNGVKDLLIDMRDEFKKQ